jgi:hypothetical protein
VKALICGAGLAAGVIVAQANFGLLLRAFTEVAGTLYGPALAIALLGGEAGTGWLFWEACGASNALQLHRWSWWSRGPLALFCLALLCALIYAEVWAAALRDALIIGDLQTRAALTETEAHIPQLPAGYGQQVIAAALPTLLALLSLALEPCADSLRRAFLRMLPSPRVQK